MFTFVSNSYRSKMKNIPFTIFFLLLFNTLKLNAQCLVAPGFQASDTVCASTPVTFSNTSISNGASSYNWDFCPGDLANQPTAAIAANINGLVNNPIGLEQVFDGTNYFAFIANYGTNGITRLDFGSSYNNTPTAVYINSIPGLTPSLIDIKLVKVDTNWFAFVDAGNSIYRIDFGNSLSNTNLTATLVNTSGALNGPYYIDFAEDNGKYYVLAPSNVSGNLTVVDLGNDILNTNPTVTSHALGAFGSSCISVSTTKVCDQWVGFVSYIGGGAITRIDFGDSLTNPAPIITNLTIAGFIPNSRKITVKHDDGNWFVFVAGASGNVISRIDLGSSISNNSPSAVSLGDINGSLSQAFGFSILKSGSTWTGITIDFSSSNVNRLSFPDPCISQPSNYSTDSIPPQVSYSDGGWQHIELTMLNNGGESIYLDSVFISPSPLPAFTQTPVCLNGVVEFNNQSTISLGNLTAWNWDFGDVTNNDTAFNPTHTYNALNSYTVTLIATSDAGCIDSVKNILTVNSNPVAQFTSSGPLCSGYQIPFTDASTDSTGVSNWLWDFDDQTTDTTQSPMHSYSNSGQYDVMLKVTSVNGCFDSTSNTLNVIASPVTSFVVANTCIGETALFNNQTVISDTSSLTYLWNFGDTDTSTANSPAHAYPIAVANYNVSLLAQSTNGCVDSTMQLVHIGNKPQAWFTFSPDTACAGNSITFSDSSFIATGDSITNLYWDFGDNTYDSISNNPSHIYQSSGIYTVTLTAHSPASCDSTITRNVFVIASPQANFSTGDVCFGNAATFTDLSQAPSGSTITNWQWSFGDSTFATAQDTTHNYTQFGTYSVLLEVTSSSGCVDTFSSQVDIYELPQVAFTNTIGCSGNAVNFTDQSSVTTTSVTGWNWNFGDTTSISTNQNPSHTYSFPNTYNVKLITTTQQGCKDSLSKNIFINQSPDFNIGYSNTCFGSQTNFSYMPITINPAVQTSWNFGDTTTSPQPNPNHIYATIDTFLVTLTVTDNQTTCPTSHTTPLIIHPLPTANFTSSNQCTNAETQLTDNSSISVGVISSWSWVLNGNIVSNLQNPLLQINTAGNYIIGLKVTSDAGCKDSIVQMVNIYDPPVPLFSVTPTFGIPGQSSTFLSQTANAFLLSWNFGDNSTFGIDSLQLHSYQDTGLYTVTLIATNIQGCVDTIIKTYNVLIPLLDIAVVKLTSSQQNNQLMITATLMNAGNIDIHNTELKITIDGVNVIHEFPLVDLPTKSPVKEYILASRIEVSDIEPPTYFCVEALNPNNLIDAVASNNELCKELTNEFIFNNITPNPGSAITQINFTVPAKGSVNYIISDANGKIVFSSGDVVVSKGFNTIPIDVRTWNSGIYFFRMSYNDSYQVLKLVRE